MSRTPPRGSAATLGCVLVCLVSVAGCATLPAAAPARGVPGFDTQAYPGRAVMAAWLEASPYRWVGFYLPAPCHRGTTWVGRRGELESLGWGIAVLFVGEQEWAEIAGAGPPPELPAGVEPRCVRENLTAERGRTDAAAAVAAAASEGFPAGTVVYLNVERVENVTPRLLAYIGAWTEAVLGEGRYLPGLYAHERNAEALYAAVAAAWARLGRVDAPRLWIASSRGFDLRRSPAESPVRWAAIWQGAFDLTETWGGHTLRIDQNVAWSPSPSR